MLQGQGSNWVTVMKLLNQSMWERPKYKKKKKEKRIEIETHFILWFTL